MSKNSEKSRVAIIGGGPSGLIAAEVLGQAGADVTIFDRMPSLARKFLLAGRGGLNLTHSEGMQDFMPRYGAAAENLAPAIEALNPDALRAWSGELGEETFVGSSGRVFPKSFKASPLLRAFLRRLGDLGVQVRTRCALKSVSSGSITIETAEGVEETLAFDAIVLALGGASWPRMGSDGAWTQMLAGQGVAISPLRPANCGVIVDWSQTMRERFAGAPLKNLALSFGGQHMRGEAIVTERGLEGGAIYALSGALREEVAAQGFATLRIDLRPDMNESALARKIDAARQGRSSAQSISNVLRKGAGLSPAAASLLRESGPLPVSAQDIAARIKDISVRIIGMAPIARAISTAGGIALDEVDENFMLKRLPGVFAAGEMLDWEAPTGGYLLQACFATGAAAGRGAAKFLSAK